AGVGRFAGALHTPDGELENTGFGSFNLEAGVGSRGEHGEWSLRAVHYGGEFKLLEADAPAPPPGGAEAGGPERKLGDERLQLRAARSAGLWRFEANAQLQRHDLIEMSDDTVPGGGG